MSDAPITVDGIELIVHTLWLLALALGVIKGIGWVERAYRVEQLDRRIAELRAATTPSPIAAQMHTPSPIAERCGLCANPRPLVGLITSTARHPFGFSIATIPVCGDCAALTPYQEAA